MVSSLFAVLASVLDSMGAPRVPGGSGQALAPERLASKLISRSQELVATSRGGVGRWAVAKE